MTEKQFVWWLRGVIAALDAAEFKTPPENIWNYIKKIHEEEVICWAIERGSEV